MGPGLGMRVAHLAKGGVHLSEAALPVDGTLGLRLRHIHDPGRVRAGRVLRAARAAGLTTRADTARARRSAGRARARAQQGPSGRNASPSARVCVSNLGEPVAHVAAAERAGQRVARGHVAEDLRGGHAPRRAMAVAVRMPTSDTRSSLRSARQRAGAAGSRGKLCAERRAGVGGGGGGARCQPRTRFIFGLDAGL